MNKMIIFLHIYLFIYFCEAIQNVKIRKKIIFHSVKASRVRLANGLDFYDWALHSN